MGRIVMLITHPAFRQPRHSGWGYDETRKLQSRRVDMYLTPMAVPMKSLGRGASTRAFNRPISRYVNALAAVGFAVDAMLEPTELSLDAESTARYCTAPPSGVPSVVRASPAAAGYRGE